MSIFSNPASRSLEQAQDYTQAILELLGTRDPLGVLRATPEALRHGVEGMTVAQLAEPEAVGRWSVSHVLQHLADSELVWGYRLRMVLASDRPPLTGYDQDRWAERFRYDQADVAEALDVFTVLRRANLRMLEPATEADLQRIGLHAERGEESVAHMIRLDAGHDLLHLRQIERIRRAVIGRLQSLLET